MSVYERRYNVRTGFVSHYVDTPEQVLKLARSSTEPVSISEGYGAYGYQDEHVTEVTRRTTRPVVPLAEIELLVETRAQAMIDQAKEAP